MAKRLPLTEKKQKWAQNRKIKLRGTQLNYNASQQAKYQKAILTLVRQMTRETKEQVSKLFHGEIADDYFEQQAAASAMDASITVKAKKLMDKLTDKFTALFSLKSLGIASTMTAGATATSVTNLNTSLKQLSGGLSLKTSVVPAGMEETAQAVIAENVSLIKSIPEQYLKDVTGSVMRSITTGNGLADLVPEISKYNGQTERRAKNIALDQTRKAYNSINKLKLQSLGVKQFEWVHSQGGQFPRKSHQKISGTVFSFENLESEQAALGVPPEDRGLPSWPPNCKCTILPVIVFDEGD